MVWNLGAEVTDTCRPSNRLRQSKPFKARGVLDDEFLELELIRPLTTNTHANAPEAKGVDPDATDA
jgi:hypothetical protein